MNYLLYYFNKISYFNKIFLSFTQKMESTKLKLYDYPKVIPKELNLNFSLTELEQKIFSFFLSNNPNNSIFRVAGGWVRDKILNIHNEDIDITIDNISGQEYISLLSQANSDSSKLYKIIRNTNEKSSKLQTATINLYGKDIDIVNLRKEIYTQNSRVPIISPGTPEEDAFRRDITINCLFYNINKKCVEDFTNQGINDLKNGIINMPKDAKISFNEDPLRTLRIIRFATRFSFQLSDNILENLNITDEFKNIISRQRIEKEFSKMMENKNYYASVYILYKYKYLEYILNAEEFLQNNKETSNKVLINFAVNFILIKSYIDKNDNYFKNKEENIHNFKILNYSCLLLPYKNIQIPEGKNKSAILSKIIAAKKLMLPKSEINEIILNIEGTTQLINLVKKPKQEIFERYNISLFLIKYKYKNLFNFIKLAICEEYLNKILKSDEIDFIIEDIDETIVREIIDKYKEIVEYIKKEKLENIENVKPLLDGKEIIKILNIKDGKQIKKYIDLIIKEQINNPNITKEDCINLIKSI